MPQIKKWARLKKMRQAWKTAVHLEKKRPTWKNAAQLEKCGILEK